MTRPAFRKRQYRAQLKKQLAAGVSAVEAKAEAEKVSIEPPRKLKSKRASRSKGT